MRTRHALALALTTLLTACATQPPPAPPTPAICAASTPTLRTDTAKRHQQILEQARQGNHHTLFLGASIIERWPTVGKDSWQTWLSTNPLNAGIGGDRTQHVLARLDDGLLDALAPAPPASTTNDIRWIVINIASNNLPDDSAPDIAAGIEAILQRLCARLPNAHIILTAVLPRGEHPGPMRDKATQANALLTIYLQQTDPDHHITLLDIGPHFVKPNGDLRTDLMPDNLHPTAAGYQLWSDELHTIIKPPRQ